LFEGFFDSIRNPDRIGYGGDLTRQPGFGVVGNLFTAFGDRGVDGRFALQSSQKGAGLHPRVEQLLPFDIWTVLAHGKNLEVSFQDAGAIATRGIHDRVFHGVTE
jgi:hypothetical protein